jgi:hypothetical protein
MELLQNPTDEEIIRKQKEEENRIYKQHSISFEDFMKRKKKWDEVQETYGADPYFYKLFGFLDPMLAISFVKEEDIDKVVDSFTEKEITIANVARNPTHAKLLRRLKDKRYEDLKNKEKNSQSK